MVMLNCVAMVKKILMRQFTTLQLRNISCLGKAMHTVKSVMKVMYHWINFQINQFSLQRYLATDKLILTLRMHAILCACA